MRRPFTIVPRLLLVVLPWLLGACSGDPGPRLDAPGIVDDATILDGTAIDGGACEGTLEFMSECSDNAECAESCLCFPFSTLGPHCTHECDGPEDCPEPSSGCGGRGVCSPPR